MADLYNVTIYVLPKNDITIVPFFSNKYILLFRWLPLNYYITLTVISSFTSMILFFALYHILDLWVQSSFPLLSPTFNVSL